MAERIFVLNGHPGPTSLTRQAMERYAAAAQAAGHEVRLVHLNDLTFDPDRGKAGYANAKPLEPVLEDALANLEWCSHFVLASPLWWGGFPAKLKGWIDRVFVIGRTFTTEETTPIGLPKPMLPGRTARVLITSDTPRAFMWFAYRDTIQNQIKRQKTEEHTSELQSPVPISYAVFCLKKKKKKKNPTHNNVPKS